MVKLTTCVQKLHGGQKFHEGQKVRKLWKWETVVAAPTPRKMMYNRASGCKSSNCFLFQPVPGSKLQQIADTLTMESVKKIKDRAAWHSVDNWMLVEKQPIATWYISHKELQCVTRRHANHWNSEALEVHGSAMRDNLGLSNADLDLEIDSLP